jgi:hypothetical protein
MGLIADWHELVEPGNYFVERTDYWTSDVICAVTASGVNHAANIINHSGQTLEATGRGLIKRERPRGMIVRVPLTDNQRTDYAAAAFFYLDWSSKDPRTGIKYNYPGLLAIGAYEHGLGNNPWVKHELACTKHLFCSQAVDYTLDKWAGYHLYDDGRPYGAVSPGNLEVLPVARGWDYAFIEEPEWLEG